MHLSLKRHSNRLPKRLPVGATYVIEGRGGDHDALRVVSRYLVLPDGQRIDLPADGSRSVPRAVAVRRRTAHLRPPHKAASSPARDGKKIIGAAGTTSRPGR